MQGVASVIGIIALVLAIIDFLLRINLESPRAMSFSFNRNEVVRTGDSEMVRVVVTARPMGAHVLYEARWRVWGMDDYFPPDDPPPVFDALSEPVEMSLLVPRARLAEVWVGLEWVVPRRFGSFAAASRAQTSREGAYERWAVYRWRWWPRQVNGRWIRAREVNARNALNGPK